MQIAPALPITSINPADPAQDLHSFQRVTAAVLQVSPAHAVLSIDGYPVVAEISSNDVAAALLGRRQAQFIVSKGEDGSIVLRLVGDQAQAAQGQVGAGPALSAKLLQAFNLPPTSPNQTVVEAAMNQRLDVSPAIIERMLQALGSDGNWGAGEANLAAAMLAAGLPLTSESLALAARPGGQLGQDLVSLLAVLSNALKDGALPPEFKEQLQTAYQVLQEVILDPGSQDGLSEKLAAAVQLLGRSLENQVVREGGIQAGSRNLAALAQLGKEAGRLGLAELAGKAEALWKDIGQAQLFNLQGAAGKAGEEWINAAFLVSLPAQEGGQATVPARLYVARRFGNRGRESGKCAEKAVLQVELPGRGMVQAEIGLSQRRVLADITLPDAALSELAAHELPGLEEQLTRLGFTLVNARLEVGEPRDIEPLLIRPQRDTALPVVNLEA